MNGRRHGSKGGDAEIVRIRMLGGFRVSVGDHTLPEDTWRLKKAAALIKLLALAPNHHLHREQAMELLWPNSGTKAASNQLRKVLHAARRTLDPTEGSRYLASDNDLLVLCPGSSLWVDVEAFEEAASTARRERAPAAYRVAIELYVMEELPAADVARIVGLPNAKAVYNRVYRALADLRERLESAGVRREDL